MTAPQTNHSKFNKAAKPQARTARKRPTPISIRLSDAERRRVKRDAGAMSLNAYIRSRLLSGPAIQPSKSEIATLLARMGQLRVSEGFNSLAEAARIGALPVDADTESDIREACKEIAFIKSTLMSALKIKEC